MKLAALFLSALAGVVCGQATPQPMQKVSRAGNQCLLDWEGVTGRTYFIQYSFDLQTWGFLPVIESGTGIPLGYGFDTDAEKMFLRLNYTDDPTNSPHSDDFDGDGISNWDEVREGGTGTNPFVEDTNGDGIRDDGLVYAALNDPDGAGLSASIQTGLIGRWDFETLDFDPASGLTFADQTGNGNHASVLAGTGLEPVDAVISKSCKIPGTGYLSIPATVMNGVKEFNISMWIKPAQGSISGSNSAKNRVIWSYGDVQTALPLLFLSIQNETSVMLRRYNGGVLENVATWTVPDKLDDGQWRHICLARANGGSTGTQYKLYINGTQIGGAAGGLNITYGNNGNGYFLLGRLAAANSVTQFDGLIDRLLLHNRGLSQAEAAELFNNDVDGDGLLDWYETQYNKGRGAWQDDPDGDPDRDDLVNLAEQTAGTDMRDADTDNDLLPDGFEVTYGLVPTDPTGDNGASGDPDGDSLVNLDEFVHITNPNNVDTDGDGTNDNVEVANAGLPNDASDGGEPADPSDVISLRLSIGDPSDSESERYSLMAKDLVTGRFVVAHVSPNFGDINTRVFDKFRRGHSYAFSVKHLDTEDGKTPDYDYFSEVVFEVPADASGYVWFDPFKPSEKEITMPSNGQKVLMDARAPGNGDPIGTGGGGSQDFIETIEPLEALLVSADLDIDSNNNEGFVYEKGSKEEDGIEAAAGLPGKVIPLNINDSDGVIDWADGFDINGADTYDDSLTGVDFVPFLLAFPGSTLDPDDVEIVFHYDASDPAAITYQTRSYTVSGMSDYDYQLPAEGTMRIWTKNADEPRMKESLAGTPKGDFIPKDTKIKWSDLVETGAPQVKLYLEAVQGEGLKSISVDIYYKGQLLITEADKINVTLMKAEMVPDYNRDGKIDAAD